MGVWNVDGDTCAYKLQQFWALQNEKLCDLYRPPGNIKNVINKR